MFVNDTANLPESGRVCIAGYRPGAGQASSHYSLSIHAARAVVEPMAEPRSPWYVLGVGAEIQSVKGPVFAAYFAGARERFAAQPDYRRELFVLVDGAVYAVRDERIAASIRRGFTTREFTLLRADRPQRTVEYPWPWYREPFAQAKPGHVRSADFLREMSAMIHAYA
jgi:hypothetical protein